MSRIRIKDLKPITATVAKVHFGELLHQASVEGKAFIVNRQGRPVAVVLSYRQYLELAKSGKG